MTTDTRVKEIAVEHEGLRVAGIVKGAGMIEPNMATMLCFLYTDADLPAQALRDCLADAVEGQLQHAHRGWGHQHQRHCAPHCHRQGKVPNVQDFKEALRYVCIELARMMARDGEGASKYFETVVTGARTMRMPALRPRLWPEAAW